MNIEQKLKLKRIPNTQNGERILLLFVRNHLTLVNVDLGKINLFEIVLSGASKD